MNIMNEDLENPPKDYLDLLSEEWTDKYTILNFGGGTGKTMLAGLLVRFQDPEGEMGISEEGWETVKQWVQNGHMEVSGEDYVGAVIDGTRPSARCGAAACCRTRRREAQASRSCPRRWACPT